MTLTELVNEAHTLAVNKGWWDAQKTPRTACDRRLALAALPEKLCLIHSEVSEALECYRNGTEDSFEGKPVGVASELADVVIRVADLCGALGIDLESVVEAKHAYNKTRTHRHGGRRA